MGIHNVEQEEAAREEAFQRRRKIVYVPPERMVALLNHAYREAGEIHGCVVVAKSPFIPDTAVCGGIYYDATRRAFVFHVLDESFPEVPDGEACEVIKPDWVAVEVATKKAAEPEPGTIIKP